MKWVRMNDKGEFAWKGQFPEDGWPHVPKWNGHCISISYHNDNLGVEVLDSDEPHAPVLRFDLDGKSVDMVVREAFRRLDAWKEREERFKRENEDE